MDLLGFVFFGAVVGAYSSFFGLGGGLLIVPLMVTLGYDMKTAVATSLAVIIPTAIVGVAGEWTQHRVDWRIVLLLAVGTMVGALLGTALKGGVSNETVRRAFAVLLIVIAMDMARLRIGGVEFTISNTISHIVRALSF